MGKGALLLGFFPALVAGLLMSSFMSLYPGIGSGRVSSDVPKAEHSSTWMEGLDDFLLPVFFIFMILFAVRLLFNIGFLGLFSSLVGYVGIIIIVSSGDFFGFLYLFFGGMLCLVSAD